MNQNSLRIVSKAVALLTIAVLLSGSVLAAPMSVRAAPGDTTRVSVDSVGAQANNASKRPSISGDGRFIAFESDASNLVPNDTNAATDIFVKDRQTGEVTRVSLDSSGAQANEGSGGAAISSDARYVAFVSDASNLVANDTNNTTDVFLRDRQLGTTIRISVSSSGEQANDFSDFPLSLSSDGRFVAFNSDATNLVANDTNSATDVFVRDNQTGVTERVSIASDGTQSDSSSYHPSISANGQFVTFTSNGNNLVGGDTNNKSDIFVRDRSSNTTTRVSVNSSGEQADGGGGNPAISGDGRFVVFLSNSRNLAPGAEDVSGKELVYVHDRQIGQTILASVFSDGSVVTVGLLDQPTISGNGRYVAFSFYDKAENNGIMNIWVRDLQRGESIRVSNGNDSSFGPSLSANGGMIAFWSGAPNLVSGDTNGASDIFVNEIASGPDRNPTVVSVTPQCGQINSQCPYPTPSSVSFIVIFSEQVSGVSADDFSLEALDGITGASITGVSGSGSEYFVTVNTGTGEGKLRLKVVDNDSIQDTSLNPLGGAGAGNGDFATGSLYWIDKSNPTVTSISRADPNPAAVGTVRFTVTFSEGVWPVNLSVFALSATGSISGASITEISPRVDEFKSVSTYTVTVNTGSGDGTLRLDLNDDDSIHDWRDNPLGGAGAGNGNFTTGESYIISSNAPPSVTGIVRSDANPTAANQVRFTLNFSEPVTGVDASDFAVTTTGSIAGANLAGVSGTGASYTVIANTGTGDGTLRLDLLDNDSIIDNFNTPLGGAGAGNGNFTTGEEYNLNRSAPVVTSILRADPNPTKGPTVRYTVNFSETVTDVDASDFALATTGNISGAGIAGITGSGNVYTVTANTGTGQGNIRLDLLDNDSIVDASSLPLGGAGAGNGNFSGEEYNLSAKPVTIITASFTSNGANDGWILESSENSNQGGRKNSNSEILRLGDDAQDRQYRSILHFPTYYLPDNAVVTEVTLMLKGQGVIGTDPFTTHQNIQVDIRSGVFGSFGPWGIDALQESDFQNPSSMDSAGFITNNNTSGWYWGTLNNAANFFINLTGVTQFRLGFQLDDNDDVGDDFITFFSGDYASIHDRPRLVIKYYIP